MTITLPPTQTIGLLDRIQQEAPPELACLPSHPRYTPRQLQVVQLAHEGKSHQEIANHLGISINTVRAHLQTARAICSSGRYKREGR
jgi:DNA-binding NarL/FixJ family response regulator